MSPGGTPLAFFETHAISPYEEGWNTHISLESNEREVDMNRLEVLNPESTKGKSRELLEEVKSKLGMTPNMMRVMANSPVVLEAYLSISSALKGGVLDPKLQEQLALTVAELNGCRYCLAAHSAIGKTVGLSDEEISDSRLGLSADTDVATAIQFARSIVMNNGKVADEMFIRVRDAGYTDAKIAEILAHVALNCFTNYFNNVVDTPLDFPEAVSLQMT